MARPTDWTALNYGADPVPGDPAVVTSAGNNYVAMAETIKQTSQNLRTLLDDKATVSEAVDAFREIAEQVAGRIDRAEQRYRGTGDALLVYAPELTSAQETSVTALTQAQTAVSSTEASGSEATAYERQLDDPALEPADRTRIEGLRDGARSEADGAAASLQAAITLLQEAIDARDTAATTAENAIHDVEQASDLNDGFWDDVDQFFEENPWVDTVLTIAGVVAGILAVVAMFVPGLNLIVGAIVVIVAVATVLNATMQALTGNKSWVDAITEIALAVLPFGAGKLIKGGLAGTRGATASAAATSQMASAAGSGVSGVTRSVAVELVETAAREGVENLRFAPVIGSEARALAETAIIANMTLRSGATSAAAVAASNSRFLWGSGYVGNAVLPAVIPPAISAMTPSTMQQASTSTVRDLNW